MQYFQNKNKNKYIHNKLHISMFLFLNRLNMLMVQTLSIWSAKHELSSDPEQQLPTNQMTYTVHKHMPTHHVHIHTHKDGGRRGSGDKN